MKRLHVHVHVADLAQSIAFYSRLFATQPSRTEADYAKWMLDDPLLNFAISTRGQGIGVDHLGIQVDDSETLQDLQSRARAAELTLGDVGQTTCCYARSEKHWIIDPQGLAWEYFHTLEDIRVFREPVDAPPLPAACCVPTSHSPTRCC
jgi:catechol 2,3-dioxygenase-like lactoylglutathione lyase family enzyme